MAVDAEGWVAFVLCIFDVGTKSAKGIDQCAYRAVFHAFGTGDDMFTTVGHGQVSSEEAHGGASRLDVDDGRHVAQGVHHHLGVVAVG